MDETKTPNPSEIAKGQNTPEDVNTQETQVNQVELQKEEKRQEILKRWENAEQKTDEELLEAFRQDGQILTRVTGRVREVMSDGHILPTAIRNLREGNPVYTTSGMYPSYAVHFCLNEVFSNTNGWRLPSGELAKSAANLANQAILFVAHPGVVATNHDISFGGDTEPDDIAHHTTTYSDVAVRGRTDHDIFDESAGINTRDGFYLIPNVYVNRQTGLVSGHAETLDEFKKTHKLNENTGNYVDKFGLPVNPPSENVITSRQYWEEMTKDLPPQKQPRLIFYEGNNNQVALDEFRRVNNIPPPDSQLLANELTNIGISEVFHDEEGGEKINATMSSGEGEFIRLKANSPESQSPSVTNTNQESEVGRYYEPDYQRLKRGLEDGIPLNDLGDQKYVYESRKAQTVHLNLLLKLKNNGDPRVTESLIAEAKDILYQKLAAEKALSDAGEYARGLEEARRKVSNA